MLLRVHTHFAHELTAESVNDTGNRWGLPLADEVEIEHTLNCAWLQAAMIAVRKYPHRSFWRHSLYEASCLVVEEHMLSWRAHWPARSLESADVVVGVMARFAIGTVGHLEGRLREGLPVP